MSPLRTNILGEKTIKLELKSSFMPQGVDEVELFEKRGRKGSFEILGTPEKAKARSNSAQSLGSVSSGTNPDIDELEFNSKSWLK